MDPSKSFFLWHIVFFPFWESLYYLGSCIGNYFLLYSLTFFLYNEACGKFSWTLCLPMTEPDVPGSKAFSSLPAVLRHSSANLSRTDAIISIQYLLYVDIKCTILVIVKAAVRYFCLPLLAVRVIINTPSTSFWCIRLWHITSCCSYISKQNQKNK